MKVYIQREATDGLSMVKRLVDILRSLMIKIYIVGEKEHDWELVMGLGVDGLVKKKVNKDTLAPPDDTL